MDGKRDVNAVGGLTEGIDGLILLWWGIHLMIIVASIGSGGVGGGSFFVVVEAPEIECQSKSWEE